jgi:radical SAM superfamily enzyme YgiQ (UPF0313 family)
MDYQGNIIRPPSEAESLILQVTVGCSHNKCTFCPTYKGTRFRLKDWDIIKSDIDEARDSYGSHVRRVFICDGDALILKNDFLITLFDRLKESFPRLIRIGIYGNTKSILRKTNDELAELKRHGLGIIYLGVESGNDEVLRRVCKGADRARVIEAGKKVRGAGIKLSMTILLGIGGKALSHEHAVNTGTLLTEVQPDYAGALTVMVVPGTRLDEEMRAGAFQLPDAFEILAELKTMLENTDMHSGLFMANHASNYLPLKLRMPKDRDNAIAMIEKVLKERNQNLLKPEFMRAL